MKYFLLFAVLVFAIVSLWVIKTVGQQNRLSLGMHVAKSKQTSLIFGIFGGIATLTASVAVFSSLLNRINAHYLIYGLFIIIFAQFLITTSLPYVESTKRGAVHNFAAWAMCFTIPIATASFLFTDINTSLKILTTTTFILEIILLAVSIGIKSQRKYFLFYQLVYLGLFFSFLLILMWN